MERAKCNCCGKTLKAENNIICEDFIHIKKSWGYFSKKDGITQELLICEDCTEKIFAEFAVTVQEYETKEMI